MSVVKVLAALAVVAAFIACGLGAYAVYVWQADGREPEPELLPAESDSEWSPDPIVVSERAALEPALAAIDEACSCVPRPVRRVQAGIWRVSLDRDDAGNRTCVTVDLSVFRVRDDSEVPEGVEILDGDC